MQKRLQSHLTVKRISSSPYFNADFSLLEKTKIEETGVTYLDQSDLRQSDILITNTHTNVASLPEAKLIVHPNSGYDNYTAEFVKRASCPIIIGSAIRAEAVANYILSALITHYERIPFSQSWHAERKWKRKLLSEVSVLIIGHGLIGQKLEKTLNTLSSSVVVYDPYKGLDELSLKNVDVVILACSLHAENKRMIDANFLHQLNDDFLLINAARGELVNTDDLKQVLIERPKAFAVLDVFEKEPFDFSYFKNVPNVLLSSHIAGVFSNIDQATVNFEVQVLNDFSQLALDEFESKYFNLNLKNRIKGSTLI